MEECLISHVFLLSVSTMNSQLIDFFSLLYPRVCINCNQGLTKNENYLCLGCDLSLPKSPYLASKVGLLKRFVFQPKVTGAYAYLDYVKDGIAQKLIRTLKYDGKQELGVWLGQRFGVEIKKVLDQSVDLIIPIPLHPKRLQMRGYNQSARIAEGMGKSLKVLVDVESSIRSKQTSTQTKETKLNRWKNMQSAFEIVAPDTIRQKAILVVDDVITTGATLGIFCDELAKYKPASLTIAALAVGKQTKSNLN